MSNRSSAATGAAAEVRGARPRQLRAERTRSRVMDAGRQAFARLGHDSVNLVSDVLEPAGVSVGSFYHQFRDKTDLLIAILDDAAVVRKAEITDVRGESLDDVIHQATERFFASLDDESHLWRIQARERLSAEPRIRDRVVRGRAAWRELIVELFRPHWTGDQASLERAADMVGVFFVGMVPTYLDLPPARRRRERARLIASTSQFLIHGIGADSPEQESSRG